MTPSTTGLAAKARIAHFVNAVLKDVRLHCESIFIKYLKEREMCYTRGKNLEKMFKEKNRKKTLNKKSKGAA